jgi:hypothetical protein
MFRKIFNNENSASSLQEGLRETEVVSEMSVVMTVGNQVV